MKTTLNIDDTVMRRLKQEAAARGCTMSELLESALRLVFRRLSATRKCTESTAFGKLPDVTSPGEFGPR